MKTRLGCIGLLFLTGCATSALTIEDAKQYASLDLNEFLAKRFNDKQSRKVGNTIRYQAYFNDVNFVQLERPTTEIVNFCNAQGGTAERTETYSGDLFQRYRTSATRAFLEGSAYARSRGLSRDQAAAVGEELADQAQQHNKMVDARARGYKTDWYGEWSCRGAARPWRVIIVPVGLTPHVLGNVGSGNVDMMVIEITPR